MSMSPSSTKLRAVPCRYFLSAGGCTKGHACPFSHEFTISRGASSDASDSNVCRFFLQGTCAYGSKCRYDHVRPKRLPAVAAPCAPQQQNQQPPTKSQTPSTAPASTPVPPPPRENPWAARAANAAAAAPPTLTTAAAAPSMFDNGDEEGDDDAVLRRERALAISEGVECGICLERVLAKDVLSERRFGILTGCSHPFCLMCIRGWRGTTDRPGADIDGAVRACPLCRAPSHFVVPSTVWFADEEDKDAIIQRYVSRLNNIDCRHFNQGAGTCPFGTSCFYRHRYADGTLEETSLRKYGNADGEVNIVQPVRLAEFLSRSHIL